MNYPFLIACVVIALILIYIFMKREPYNIIPESPESIRKNSRKNLINVFGEDSGYIL